MTRSRKDKNPAPKKSRRAAKPASEPEAEELDALEEWSGDEEVETLDELDELDAFDESTVEIGHGPADEDEFDVRLTVPVGDMERNAICGSIAGPLRSKVEELAKDLRWKRVVVTFTGDAVIPTAAKELVAQVLPAGSPLSVTVQRGYPDELVYEGERPTLSAKLTADGDTVRLDVDTTGLSEPDVADLLAPELDKLAAGADGKAVTCSFTGGPAPAAQSLREPLIHAGATHVVVESGGSDVVIYDRVLEDMVTVTPGSTSYSHTLIEVAAGEDSEQRARALDLVLPQRPSSISARRVVVKFGEVTPGRDEFDALDRLAGFMQPKSIVLNDGDVVWPRLLRVAQGEDGAVVKMDPGDREDVRPAFHRELPGLELAGRAVTFDWPTGMALDEGMEMALVAARPAALAFTFAGEDREPFWPVPVQFQAAGDVFVCELDTDAGKPVELVRALQRRLATQDFAGRKVDVQIKGDGLVSRTMRQALLETLTAGGTVQARLLDHGATEYLLPKLLAFETDADGGVEIRVAAADRDADEIAAAAASELGERALEPGAQVRLYSSDADAAIVAALLDAGAARIVLVGDTEVQVHPALFGAVERSGADAAVRANPDADTAALSVQVTHELPGVLEALGDLSDATVTLHWPGTATSAARTETLDRLLAAGPAVLKLDDGEGKVRQLHPEVVRTYVDVLGRRDAGTPPMIIIGVDIDDQDGVTAAMDRMQSELDGRRVLVVFRDEEREIRGPDDNPVVQSTLARLASSAPAVLAFRPASRKTPAHFEVVSSSLEGLAVGAKMRDPRG